MSNMPPFPTPGEVERDYIDTIKNHAKTDALRTAIRSALRTDPGPRWVIDLTGFGGFTAYAQCVMGELQAAGWEVSTFDGGRNDTHLAIEPAAGQQSWPR